MFTSLVERITVALLTIALLVAVPFAGWNWWRKNVYYEALQVSATSNAKRIAETEAKLNAKARDAERTYKQEAKERERILEEQLAEIRTTPPAERVVYKLRDRWLPVSCPGGPAGGDGPAEAGGLQAEDEQFLVRLAADADELVHERNFLVERYNEYRRAVIEHNRKVRQK